MKIYFVTIFLLIPFLIRAQLLVYTVAGNDTSTAYTTLGDGGPAIACVIGNSEGIWLDTNCNLYISDLGDNRVRKVDATTGIITTIAGTTIGNSGDGGPATDAKINSPYGLYADIAGNVYFADLDNNRIRRVDAITGILTTFAGGGTSFGDGGPATNAQLNYPVNVYGDSVGNMYIAETGRIRMVNIATDIITTIAGTGVFGLSGDGGPATAAQLSASGMLFDENGNLYFADRGNDRIRKITASTGIITTIAGTTEGFSGDGGPATAAQLSGPISFAIDLYHNLIIGDNQNNVIRKVDATTGIINTIAGVGTSTTGSDAEGTPATVADIHPEFLYLDLQGNIYYSNYGRQVRKIINYNPGLPASGSRCGTIRTGVQTIQPISNKVEIYPNPAHDEITIIATDKIESVEVLNLIGQEVYKQSYSNTSSAEIPINNFANGVYFVKVNGVYGGKFVKE